MGVEADPVGVQKSTVSHFKIKVLNRYVLLLKRTFFSNVQLWWLVFLNPVRVQRRTVSHFKGLFKTFKMRYSTFLYSYWIGLHVHFKKAILHLKRAIGPLLLSLCVYPIPKCYYTYLGCDGMAAGFCLPSHRLTKDGRHHFSRLWLYLLLLACSADRVKENLGRE